MSYQYGSDVPEIKNPLKQEGLIYLISGSLILVIGIISFLSLKGDILGDGLSAGWSNLLVCILLLIGGMTYITKGLFKIFRFYVGRGVPSSLCRNMTQSEKHESEPDDVSYQAGHLNQMIMKKKNITFREPITLFDRMAYSLFPKFIFLPYAMRNYLHILVTNTGYSLIALLIYFMAITSGSMGLTQLNENNFSNWMGIGLCIYLFALWLLNPPSVGNSNKSFLNLGKRSSVFWVIAFLVFVPTIVEILLRYGIEIPEAPFNPTVHIVILFILIPIILTVSLLISKIRSEHNDPLTEISEFREHWQENVRPKNFFRSLDMVLNNLRFKDFPNRIYRELSPDLNMEGSMDKGSFKGDTIQETQPKADQDIHTDFYKICRLFISALGHIFVILAALLLFQMNQKLSGQLSFSEIFSSLYFPGLLWIFGIAAISAAHLHWGELKFNSYLIQFQGDGTFTESKISAGMAITDPVPSENTDVRTSFSPWLHVTQIMTSTQVKKGPGNLSGPRYIMSMHKADPMLIHLVKEIKLILENKETIGKSVSKKDIESIQTLFEFNEVALSKEAPKHHEPRNHEEDQNGSQSNKDTDTLTSRL